MEGENEWENESRIEHRANRGNGRNLIFLVLFAIGIMILLLGLLLGAVSDVIREPDEYPEDEKKVDRYETTTRWINFFSSLSVHAGLVFVASGAFITAVINKNMHPTIRAGLAIAGGLILGFIITGLNTIIVF